VPQTRTTLLIGYPRSSEKGILLWYLMQWKKSTESSPLCYTSSLPCHIAVHNRQPSSFCRFMSGFERRDIRIKRVTGLRPSTLCRLHEINARCYRWEHEKVT
jgi:hypothetical protein